MGYNYLGPDSLYQLTWFEIMDLVDAMYIQMDMQDMQNIRQGDLDRLQQFDQQLQQTRSI